MFLLPYVFLVFLLPVPGVQSAEYPLEGCRLSYINETLYWNCEVDTTLGPTGSPVTTQPTAYPSEQPTRQPTLYPSDLPTKQPTFYPSAETPP